MLGLGKKSWQLKHKQADQWAVWQRAPEENTLEAWTTGGRSSPWWPEAEGQWWHGAGEGWTWPPGMEECWAGTRWQSAWRRTAKILTPWAGATGRGVQQQANQRARERGDGQQQAPTKTLEVLYLNAQSLVTKVNELHCTVSDLEPDVVLVTKT